MKPYDVNQFWNDLRNDIWALKVIGELPTNPPPQMLSTYDEKSDITTNSISSIDDICMDARQDAINAYRKQLAPMVFTFAQKVYAEIFRLVLSENNIKADTTQDDVGKKIKQLLQPGSTTMVVSPIFRDQIEFDDWWKGHYRYDDFRLARNQVIHSYYYFDGSQLKVDSKQRTPLLNWNTDEVFDFAECMVAKSKEISMAWSFGSNLV